MLQDLFTLKRSEVPARVGLRNTAGIALPLALGAATGHLSIGLGVSVGAMNSMMSDIPGPYRLRFRRMLITAIAASGSAFIGYVIGDDRALSTFAVLLWGFAGGLMVALGPDAARAGTISVVLLIVSEGSPSTPSEALGPSLLVLAGGLLQMLFAIAAWPLGRFRPERDALSAVVDRPITASRYRPLPTR